MSRFTRVLGLAVGLLLMAGSMASAGLYIGSGRTLGYPPNGFTTEASNIVNYAFSNGIAAPNEFAIFQTHDPWGGTIVKDAITGAAHTFTEFTPAQLTGFAFNTYRVVVLNWDDHFLGDFTGPYIPVIPMLEAYVNAGGVLWIQGSIQGTEFVDSYPLPFGGTMTMEFQSDNFIADPTSPMMAGISSPISGNFSSHASATGLPGSAHVVVTTGAVAGGTPTLYDLISVPVDLQSFTVE